MTITPKEKFELWRAWARQHPFLWVGGVNYGRNP